MPSLGRLALVPFLDCSALACTPSTEKPAVSFAMQTPGSRVTTFEAVARVMDDHPEYVDEFNTVAMKHPVIVDRRMKISSSQMEDPQFAHQVAAHLMDHPKAVEQILMATVDEARSQPKDRAAMDRAIGERHVAMADSLGDSSKTVTLMAEAQADAMMTRDSSRKALLAAMQSRAPEFAAALLSDPETLHVMLDAMVKKAGSDRDALKNLFSAAF